MTKDNTAPAPTPQVNFSLGNPGDPDTIYVTTDKSANKLSLVMTPTVAAAYTPGQLVELSNAPADNGSILFLDLTPLGLDSTVFSGLKLTATGWTSQPFVDSVTNQMVVAFTPSANVPSSIAPLSFALDGFALAAAPSGGPTTLDLLAFNVGGIISGFLSSESGCPVSFAPPPGKKANLRDALTATLTPADVVVSTQGYPSVSNRLQLTLSQSGSVSIPANDKTEFRLTVVYSTDPNGFGALLSAAEGENISIPIPQGGNWTPTNVEGTDGRSWLLKPAAGASILGAGGAPVVFTLDPVVSAFQPGPTVALLSYSDVPGFADGAFRLTLTKQPHVRIDKLTVPPLSTLTNGKAKITIKWNVANADRLVLSPLGGDVSGTSSFTGTIETTTLITLTAYGPGSGDTDNMAIANKTATVIPVLNSFSASPGAVSVDDFGGGDGANVTLDWGVNIDAKATLELTSSATGGFAMRFGPTGSTIPNVTEPQMFTLNVVGDTRPQDQWRLYLPAFKLQVQEISAGGGWPAAAPGASYVAVSQAGSNQLSILSTASYTQITTVATGAGPQGLVFSPDGSTIYVANTGDGSISVIGVTTNAGSSPPWNFTPGTAIQVGNAPTQLALAPSNHLYATVGNGSAAGFLASIPSGGAVSKLQVGVGPYGIAVLPSGAQVFVANQTDGTVSQVGIAPDGSMQLVRTLPGLPGAAGLAITPDGNVLLVACSDGTVQLLDATAPDTSPRTPVNVGGRPLDIALDPSGSYAFVTDSSGAKVSLVSIAKQAVLGQPLSVAAGPTGISVSPDGTLAFVGHASGLSVLTLASYAARTNPPDCGGVVTDVVATADRSKALIWANAATKFSHSKPAPGLVVYTVQSETLEFLLASTPIIDLALPATGNGPGFLTQMGQSAIYPLDPTALTLGTALPLPSKSSAPTRQPRSVAMSADGKTVFVLVDNGGSKYGIAVFTSDTNGNYSCVADLDVMTAMFAPLTLPLVAAPDGSAAYAYDGTNSALWSVTQGQTGSWSTCANALTVGGLVANGLVISPNCKTLYLVSQANNQTTFYVVDCAGWTAQTFILSEPSSMFAINGLAMAPDGTRMFASDQVAGAVRVIDTRSLRFLQTIAWPQSLSGPAGIAVTNDQSRIFVATSAGNFGAVSQVEPPPSESHMVTRKKPGVSAIAAALPTANGVFIRHQLGDSPGNNGGSWSSCPDIYFSTTSPTDHTPISLNPNTIITDAGYAAGDNGSWVTQGIVNYVYLRARNNASSLNPVPQMKPRLWFLYADSNLALWPQQWLTAGIQVGGNTPVGQYWQQDANITQSTTASGIPLMVTAEAFLWKPPVLTDGSHYCCISMAENPYDNPPWVPNPGAMPTLNDLMNFVLTNDWFGWRNTQAANGLGQTWQQTVPLTGPPQAGAAYVGVACNNMPTDGFFAYTVMGPTGVNAINVPKTPITAPNQHVTNPMVFPANFSTQVIITYWQGPTTPPAGASITPVLEQEQSAAEEYMLMKSGRLPSRRPHRAIVYNSLSREFDHWKTFYSFGAVPFRWEPIPPATGMVSVPRGVDELTPQSTVAETSWQQSFPVTGPPEAELFYAGVQIKNMPTDGFFAASMAGPDVANSLNIPRSPITAPNMTVTEPLVWPAGFDTEMIITYWQGPTVPPADASIEPVLIMAQNPE